MSAEQKPLIVQGDGTIFLEVEHDPDHLCRDSILRFSELIKSPEHVHTYRITPLAIWNAASSRISLDDIMNVLIKYSKYSIPPNIEINIRDWYSRYCKKEFDDPPRLYATGRRHTFWKIRRRNQRIVRFLLEAIISEYF